jgi:hypothetical protein
LLQLLHWVLAAVLSLQVIPTVKQPGGAMQGKQLSPDINWPDGHTLGGVGGVVDGVVAGVAGGSTGFGLFGLGGLGLALGLGLLVFFVGFFISFVWTLEGICSAN